MRKERSVNYEKNGTSNFRTTKRLFLKTLTNKRIGGSMKKNNRIEKLIDKDKVSEKKMLEMN